MSRPSSSCSKPGCTLGRPMKTKTNTTAPIGRKTALPTQKADAPRVLYVALLAATLILVGIAVGNSAEACGKERWPVKVGTDRDIAKVVMEPQQTTVAALAALVAPKNPDAQRDT